MVSGGETIELLVNATNYGSEDAYGITGTIISENDGVIIETSQVNFGDIANGMTVAAEQPFVFSIVNGLEEGHDLKLMINFTDNNDHSFNGWLDLNVSGNLLIASEIDVLASNQNLLTPGQSSFVKISLENMGSANSNSIIGTITCASPFIDIIDNVGTWTSINSGGSELNGDDYFEISALDVTIPGTMAHLILNVESSTGYQSSSIIPIQIGEAGVNDPLGPDSYGYYIYDNEDLNYILSPTYNWVEIDAREGGPGSHLSSLSDTGNNQDDVETINLPFTFRFYGVEYDQISISSNGWIAMGETELESFRNYELPGVGGPSKMIAVFWDDLKTSNGGRVYTWYDQDQKSFMLNGLGFEPIKIIRWKHFKPFYSIQTIM